MIRIFFVFVWLLPVSVLAQFQDVPEGHPHYEAIEYVRQQKVVQGYEDGTYRPDETINRVEFLKILLEGHGEDLSSCGNVYEYSDVDWSAWYGVYVQRASCEGIVEGYADGSFRPASTINYAEAAKIVNGVFRFQDLPGDPWYGPYIHRLQGLGAVPREDIQPGDLLTRGEMAEMIQALMTEAERAMPFGTSPNVLLIIADDMGLDATPWHAGVGARKPVTPTLSALAEKGMVMDNVWSNPLCSPTRAGILTGKYGVHTGVLGPVGRSDAGIGVDEYTLQQHIAEYAPTAYAQAVIGKWHLSTNNNGSNDNPALMGVPHYSGFISGGMRDYNAWQKVTNGSVSQEERYATSVFTDEASAWIGEQDTPWFLWLAYTAPHTPFHDPPQELIHTPLDGTEQGQYMAAIEAMDTEIGRLIDNLPAEQKENTVIIFMGDNGTPGQVAQSPYGRQTAKGSLYQGGIHVPMVISGPGVMPGRNAALIQTTDLFATIAEITGAPVGTYENSRSLVPLIVGTESEEREYVYAEISTTDRNTGEPSTKNGWTVRDAQFKYIEFENGERALFDLMSDPYETQNKEGQEAFEGVAERLRNVGLEIRQ